MTTASRMPLLRPFEMPALGIGTYQMGGEACTQSVCRALQMGYRLIDTAASYRNEAQVGQGIALSGVPRCELFVIVKINLKAMASEEKVRSSIENSLDTLGIGYADCAIMHWPARGGLQPEDAQGNAAARACCWKAMQDLQQEGKIRYMGVSNFLERHFVQIPLPAPESSSETGAASTAPFTYPFPIFNQIELHPLCVQSDLVRFCRQHGMMLQQYAPLGQANPELLQHPKLVALQAQHFPTYSVSDLVLMWGLSQGFSSLVRSSSAVHLRQNWEAGLAYFCTDAAPLGTRPPLTAAQRAIVVNLREHLDLDESAPDRHFFWYSSRVA